MLGSLAAACAVAVALRANWNPLPALGAMMAAAAVYIWGPKAYDKAKNGFFHPQLTAERYIQEYFNISPGGDPLWHYPNCPDSRERYCAKEDTDDTRAYLNRHLAGLRPFFVPLDGSDKLPTFNHVHPTSLPIWLRLALLPDLIGLNEGGRQLWRLSPPLINVPCNNLRSPAVPLYFTTANEVYSFQPLGHAPDIAAWERAYPRIKYLFNGKRFTFSYNARYGEVDMVTWAEGAPEGKFLGAFPQRAGVDAQGVPAEEMPAEALPYAPLPFNDNPHPHGHLADGYLYFGEQFLDRAKGGHWMKIADLNNTLVMGTAGFGKSVFLNQVLEGVFYNRHRFDNVYLVDLKGGVELWPYRNRGDHVRVIKNLSELGPVVSELVEIVERRLDEMREGGHRMWPGPKTLFVVDEYAQIQLAPETTKEERQQKQEMMAKLNKLSMLCRAAGVILWAQLQKGTTDVMDSSFRANLANQVCFKVPNKLTAAGMFGSTDELLVDPVKLPKGRFVFYDASNGETHYLQARVTSQ